MRKFILYLLILVLIVTIGCATSTSDKSKEEYFAEGLTYKKFGEYDLAMDEFNRAIEIDPTYAIAYALRGATGGLTLSIRFLKEVISKTY